MQFSSVQFNKSSSGNQTNKIIFGSLASVVIGLGFFLTIVQPGYILTDGGIYSAVAYKDLNGGQLYLNAWDNKPPGIFYLIELFYLIIPNPVYALFVLSLVGFSSISFTLFRIAFINFKSLILSLAFIIVALYFTIFKNNIGDGLYTEIYGTLSILVSYFFYLNSKTTNKNRDKIIAMILSGLGFWFKEPFLLICLPLMMFYFLEFKNTIKWQLILLYCGLFSLIFLLVLTINGSLQAFIDIINYNYLYSKAEAVVSIKEKLKFLSDQIYTYTFWVNLICVYLAFQNIKDPSKQRETIVNIIILLSALYFILVSPFNFGHYYFPLFTLTFLVVANIYGTFDGDKKGLKWLMFILFVTCIYKIDKHLNPKIKFEIEPYTENKIIKRLRADKYSSLFVDYVTQGNYYIKSRKVHPTFLPVGLNVHFLDDSTGLKNRARIWKELNENKPDYILTTFTTSNFSWSLPDSKFYEKNYMVIDSIEPKDELKILLWKKKQN